MSKAHGLCHRFIHFQILTVVFSVLGAKHRSQAGSDVQCKQNAVLSYISYLQNCTGRYPAIFILLEECVYLSSEQSTE